MSTEENVNLVPEQINREDLLRKLATDFNGQISTPCYVYSSDLVVNAYQALKQTLGTKLIVSIKANHCQDLLSRCSHQFEDGIEVASLGELELCASSGLPIFVNTPLYNDRLVLAGAKIGATFILDNPSQITFLRACKNSIDFRSDVMLRINVSELLGLGTRRIDNFGMSIKDATDSMVALNGMGVETKGFHLFGGSGSFQNLSTEILKAARKLHAMLSDISRRKLEYINLGGGFPTNWRELDFSAYVNELAELKREATIFHESGRGVFGSCGFFVVDVRAVKHLGREIIAICNGGMPQNFLLARTENILKKYEIPFKLTSGKEQYSGGPIQCTFIGPTCNKEDIIGKAEVIEGEVSEGDRIVFYDCGAYNATYTVARFLALDEVKEYVI